MSHAPRLNWSSRDRYSPVQPKAGLADPAPGELPPAVERVPQAPDPFSPQYLDEREILRVTYQGDDRCQLRCPGCYTGQRLEAPHAIGGPRRRTPFQEATDHMLALGDGLRELYLIGAEPTMDPELSRDLMAWAGDRGLGVTSITNGAVSAERFDRTFAAALEQGLLYSLTVSLDSMVPAVNNRLRGRGYAFDRALATITRCVQAGVELNVQTTVWPENYPYVLDSLEQLYALGVRGFSFHCGSLEGVPDHEARGLGHVDPLAWRALCGELAAFRKVHRESLRHFVFPWLFFTVEELRDSVLGTAEATEAYLAHFEAVEGGESRPVPVRACPALDVPQVYVYGNDGPGSRGAVSLCNIHTGVAGTSFAEYEPESRRFRVVQDPERNQLRQMRDSPHLCPAMSAATGGRTSDRTVTEHGDLFHACRYLSSNQVPADAARFRGQSYAEAVERYRAAAGQRRGPDAVALVRAGAGAAPAADVS